MQDITVEELKSRMDKEENLFVIDVREPYEYEEYNIGAELIPLGALMNSIDDLEDYKNEEIVVHCRSGARSGQAKEMLKAVGFTKVRNLLGGMLKWQELYG
ncbi:MAG: rhodanese-like domain-containing protein [Chitinophagales bacterium]